MVHQLRDPRLVEGYELYMDIMVVRLLALKGVFPQRKPNKRLVNVGEHPRSPGPFEIDRRKEKKKPDLRHMCNA